MQTNHIILIGLALMLACVFNRFPRTPCKAQPGWSQHLRGWRKILGFIAFLAVLLLMINPEFLALGLIGDTAFFDLLVLALSLQMHMIITQAWQRSATAFTAAVRWMGIPSPGLCYLLGMGSLLLGSAVSFVQKTAQRLIG